MCGTHQSQAAPHLHAAPEPFAVGRAISICALRVGDSITHLLRRHGCTGGRN